MKQTYIVDGVRTPIGKFKGTLAAVRTDDLAAMTQAPHPAPNQIKSNQNNLKF